MNQLGGEASPPSVKRDKTREYEVYIVHLSKDHTYENKLEKVLLYIVRLVELLITGAAGGALGSGL